MLIDWFTVVAQAVNFLILVWLLQRFLYRPIIKALDAREQRIAAEISAADADKASAQAAREEYQGKNATFEREQETRKRQLVDELAQERRQALEQMRTEMDGLRAKRQAHLEKEFDNLQDSIAQRTQTEVLAIARQTLSDLAGVALEARMVTTFLQHLGALDAGKLEETLAGAAENLSVQVRSAFALTPEQRTAIEAGIKAAFPAAALQIDFAVVPDLIGGVELIAQGRKIAWSIADHLTGIESRVGELLKAPRKVANE